MAKGNGADPPPVFSSGRRLFGSFRTDWRAWAMATFWFGTAVFLLTPPERVVESEAGAFVMADLYAPADLEVVDVEATALERRRIEQRYQRKWTYRPEVAIEAEKRLNTCFEILAFHRGENLTGSGLKSIADEILEKADVRLRIEDLNYLFKNVNLQRFHANLTEIARRTISSHLIVADEGLLSRHLDIGVGDLRLPPDFPTGGPEPARLQWPKETRAYLTEIELGVEYYPKAGERPLVDLGAELLMQVLRPTLEYDVAATEGNRTAQLRALEARPRLRLYPSGAPIARGGDLLTETQALAVADVNEFRRRAFPLRLVGIVIAALFCFVAIGFYLGRFRGEVTFTPSIVTMLCLPVLIALGIGRLLMGLDVQLAGTGLQLTWVLFPAALVGMLPAIMMGAYAGLSLVLASGLLFGIGTGQSLDFFVLALFGGFTAVISLRVLRERKDVLTTGFRVGLVNMAALGFLWLLRYPAGFEPILFLGGMLNGLACAALALPIIVVFEHAFGVVTDMRLLELTSPHHPLIREMEDRAPGSYQHVLNVTKLAESAAEAIGANYLLVRAGAYFHDVGKMLKPKYFSENQVTLEDKKAHSKLSPYMSVLIIKNHVKEGIEIAKEYGLPQKIIDFIPQHHGTSLIRYFYAEALRRYEESASLDVVHEEDFRYPGPKPQSIETAIVLLSDSVEAIATSTFTGAQVNENDLRRVVAEAVTERFNDGQFDECDLTMRDLFQIRESFVKTLTARFHQRITYPAAPKRETPREGGGREPGVTIAPVAASQA